MSRPESVRCENCCYFLPARPHTLAPEVSEGYCTRYPPQVMEGPDENFPDSVAHAIQTRVHGRLWCGEFREKWPEA